MDVLDLLDLCRICLSDGASIPIFGTITGEWKDISEKLASCFGEQVEDIFGYPRNICDQCNRTLSETFTFINKYRESRQVLERALVNTVKQEFVDFNDDHDFHDQDDFSIKLEADIKTDHIKLEPTRVFDNAEQFKKLVKPLAKSSKNATKNKGKRKSCDKVKSEKDDDGKKKKTESSKLTNNNSLIAASILEGQFLFSCGKWSYQPENSMKKEKKTSNQNYEKKNEVTPPKPPKPTQPVPKLCELCGETFLSPERLSRHRESVHKNQVKAKCPICNNTYKNEYYLSKHVARVHSERNFICSLCGSRFAFEKELRMHHKNVHIQKKKPKKQTCKICGKELCNAKTLLIHERSAHTGERPAVCSVCGTSFYHEDYLNIHMRLHTGEKPFKCPVCGQGYAQSCNMKSHIKHNHRLSQLDEITRKNIHPRYLKHMQP
ncbi:hypothetical protein O0L34_g13719 [Tuta absoluta]|nr:hypothetical protein O0L34_g13719 [Tuta absoluta]